MPQTKVVFYVGEDGVCPFIEWTEGLHDALVDKLILAVEDLERDGCDLRRPTTDFLRDGIYELRIRYYNVQYRILYFFHGQRAAVLSHGVAKEDKVPDKEINRAIGFKCLFEGNPDLHTYQEPHDDE